MIHLKNNKLEKLRGIFFQFGLIVAGGITLLAFEWTSPKYAYELPPSENTFDDGIWEYPPLLPEKEIEKPKVKITQPKLITDAFKKVDNDTKIPEEKKEEVITPKTHFVPDFKEVVEPVETPIFTIVENMPEFIGGEKARLKYLHDNLKYPLPDKSSGVEGTVYMKFLVNNKGEIKDIEILRGVSETIDKEAIRVVKGMPNWKPGKQRGREVNVSYNFRIKFQLN